MTEKKNHDSAWDYTLGRWADLFANSLKYRKNIFNLFGFLAMDGNFAPAPER
jgi:hypothetical protein